MKKSQKRTWGMSLDRKMIFSVLILFGLLPFVLRIGLDTHEAGKQPVLEIYRDWRWGPEVQNWRSGSAVIFERQKERDPQETMFMIQLQKDFRVQPEGQGLPRIRAFFDPGRVVQGRIEVLPVSGSEWVIFKGKSRYPNNGILFGLWLGVLFFIIGVKLRTSIWATAVGMLLWAAEWNPLGIPELFYNYGHSVVRELSLRFHFQDWTSGDLGRVPDLALLLWLPVGLVIALLQKFEKKDFLKRNFWIFVATFLAEPLILWSSSIFGKWPEGSYWWKIYLGSWGYRFFTLSFLFFLATRPQNIKKIVNGSFFKKHRIQSTGWVLLLPFCFVMTGAWDWLGAVFFDGMSEPILKMKSFLIGAVVGSLIGSRLFGIWIITFSMAVLHPPSRGHWSAAANYGLLWEGLAVGWWLSPLKGFIPRELLDLKPQLTKYILMALCWVLGVFLSSVGVPLGLSWLVLLLAIWAVLALRGNQTVARPERSYNLN